jgi:hypothetical protein
VEVSGYYDPEAGGDPWLAAGSLLLRWSPLYDSGWFLKGGGGYSLYKGLVPVGETPPDGGAFSLEVGTGWDFGTSQGIAVSPFLDLIAVPSADISNGGDVDISGATIYVIQLGVSLLKT